MKTDLVQYLTNISYPGRGILIGVSDNPGLLGVIAYFITGRSENSRNRVFVTEGEGIRTQAFDPDKISDPSLIIYSPVRSLQNAVIVTNGDQTDTIYNYLKEDKSFEQALDTRLFEPDAPNYTPRISGLLHRNVAKPYYNLSIIKSRDGSGSEESCQRLYYQYEGIKGLGHLIHTYQGDGSPLPPFQGEPVPVHLTGDIDSFSEKLWNSLDSDNRISLFVRYINLKDGSFETKIINKHK